MSEAWPLPSIPLSHAIYSFTNRVGRWNKEVFGNIFICRKRCLAQIHDIQNRLPHQQNLYLQRLEHNLMKEYNEILKQEENYQD